MASAAPLAAVSEAARPVSRGLAPRRPRLAALGLLPFAAYVGVFLLVPGVVAFASGFVDREGRFTLANLRAFGEPAIQSAFLGSAGLSAASAVVGALVGLLVCVGLLGLDAAGRVRTAVDAAASVLAQFGGVMLAFAFIATIGIQGLVTVWLKSTFGLDINAGGPILYRVSGLVLPYVYFQAPLMVLTFMPALEGLKPQWAEATAVLGGSRWVYWRRVALPIVAPAFFGSLILLFANGFASYATAAAIIAQGGIVPLTIKQQLTSETIPGLANTAGVLALGMVVVMAVLMTAYALLARATTRWQRR